MKTATSFNFLKKILGISLNKAKEENLIESIQSNLILILNTRQGMTEAIPDFGLPDIHQVYNALPKSLDGLGEEIRRTISKYEPRLQNVTVRFLNKASDTFRASYHIVGEVREGSSISKITFQTDVIRDGSANAYLVNQYQ
ncbi:MAG: type VI secretion system baseplate subunit TssE [Acidobacteria bacterium]|nr:type VI secretion system baseplate subunit TssE [Acidobacteriota bacterium]MCB9398987.1 type VI secretion system baseplate subunit TssE [Acidobacteriota bacterium]